MRIKMQDGTEREVTPERLWCELQLMELFDGNKASVATWLQRNSDLDQDAMTRAVRKECNLD
jgi:hypothetical protein